MKRWLMTLMGIAVGIVLSSFPLQQAQANTGGIQVFFEGERLTFEDTEPVLIDNRTMVPFRAIFEALDFEVEWREGAARQVVGTKEGLTIELSIGGNEAMVNGKRVELDVPAQLVQSRTLVPLRFVAENSGFYVGFTNESGVSIVGIGRTEESAQAGVPDQVQPGPVPSEPDPDSASPEPYVVKGKVVNALGQPLSGVVVYADNTFVYDSWIEGVTDQHGNYRLQLPTIASSYRMGAIYETEYNNETVPFHFDPKPNHAFANTEGAVRDFVLDINKGTIQVFEFDYYPDEAAPDVRLIDIEFALKSVGPLVDGSKDRMFTVSPDETSLTVEEVPIGTYELSAVWKPEGYREVPMLVRVRYTEEFKEKTVITFDNPFLDAYIAQIDLAFP